MLNGFEVIRGGMTAQLQDLGRRGFANIGVTAAGPMDYLSFYWANKCLANPLVCSQLELANGGIVLGAHVHTSIAVTGAESKVTINNKLVPLWRSLAIKPGDEIAIAAPKKGVFNYLSVRGGFQVRPVLNSMSTSMREGLGGLSGKGLRIKQGDVLPAYTSRQQVSLSLAKAHQPTFDAKKLQLRLIPGANYDRFAAEAKRLLIKHQYAIHNHSNRMGYRLSSKQTLTCELPNITSEPVAYGSVQVPNSDELIVMLNDRQTLGGYPKLGTIYEPDCWVLAQARPGTKVEFKVQRLSIAQNQFRRLIQQLNRIKLHAIAP